MKEESVRQVLTMLDGKIPEEKKMMLRDRLLAAPEAACDRILCAKLHNPTTVLLLSIFLGGLGVDRFMIGDTGLGIAKLLFGWATCGIWPLIDIFISHNKAKEKNFNELMMQL